MVVLLDQGAVVIDVEGVEVDDDRVVVMILPKLHGLVVLDVEVVEVHGGQVVMMLHELHDPEGLHVHAAPHLLAA